MVNRKSYNAHVFYRASDHADDVLFVVSCKSEWHNTCRNMLKLKFTGCTFNCSRFYKSMAIHGFIFALGDVIPEEDLIKIVESASNRRKWCGR